MRFTENVELTDNDFAKQESGNRCDFGELNFSCKYPKVDLASVVVYHEQTGKRNCSTCAFVVSKTELSTKLHRFHNRYL